MFDTWRLYRKPRGYASIQTKRKRSKTLNETDSASFGVYWAVQTAEQYTDGADGAPGADEADEADGAEPLGPTRPVEPMEPMEPLRGADESDGANGADEAHGAAGADEADGAAGADGAGEADGAAEADEADEADGADEANGADADGAAGADEADGTCSTNCVQFVGHSLHQTHLKGTHSFCWLYTGLPFYRLPLKGFRASKAAPIILGKNRTAKICSCISIWFIPGPTIDDHGSRSTRLLERFF